MQKGKDARARAELGLNIEGTSVQIAGRDAYWMSECAKLIAGNGAKIIDINMGCPAKSVVNGASGSALMRTPKLALELIEAVVNAVDVPVTLKTRLGWDDDDLNAAHLAASAEKIGIKMVTIHGRTRCQFYKGSANWNKIQDVKKAVTIPVIANGDIIDTSTAKLAMDQSQADGVMIGRSIYQNPYSLVEIENEIFGTKEQPTREEVAEKLLEYLEKEVKLGTKVNHIMRHTVGLYHGQIGSKEWKRYLSDNMMARDSDFQKSQHIMTIVQNNEKANQANS